MTTKPFVLTGSLVTKVLHTVDQGLVNGLGRPVPGQMCVEAAVCYALGLPHGDDPKCVDPAIRALKIGLNDSGWSSNEARAKGLRRLSVLQLGTKDNFDSNEFAKRVVLKTIQVILPPVFRTIGLSLHADAMANSTTLVGARDAARAATARAAYAAADAAARAAAYADSDAADAVRDAVLQAFSDMVADILIDMGVPAVRYLSLIDS